MKTFKKLNMISYPTPFQEMHNLRKFLGCKPRLFVKRDDLTEVGLGGNKNRKLDYVMAEACDNGADTIITWGACQSNHCRQTLAYANILGMECHLILNGHEAAPQGNLLIYDIFGAYKYFEPDSDKCVERCETLAAELKAAGKKPYIVPLGASSALGSVGYIDCMKELAEQTKAAGVRAGHLFVGTGSAGTQAGLVVGAKLYLPECRIDGVSVSRDSAEQSPKVASCANDLAALIGSDLRFQDSDICVHDKYYGEAYAVPTQSGIDAIKLLGKTQALLLDPVYSGKAMAGMLDLLTKGMLDSAEAVVFLHTGGSPAVFHYSESFGDKL